MTRILGLLLLALHGGRVYAAGAESQPAALTTEPRVHDPCMIHAADGYYVYGTGAGIRAMRSTDLVHWERLPPVFTVAPEWASKEFPRATWIWAPDVSYFNGEYHLYYCVSNFGKNRSVIGEATNVILNPAAPNYHWVDHGKVVESFPTDNFNAIDPGIVVDEAGTPWLSFGSFWDGVKLRRLAASTGMTNDAEGTVYSLAARSKSAGRAVEAGYIIHRESYYYLVVSFDLCCRGVNSTYRTMVGRSKSVMGPYLDRSGIDMHDGGGTELLASEPNGRVRGPGGGMVLHDGDRWLLVHHFYDAEDRGLSKLQIRPLTWDADGWPQAGAPVTAPPR